MNTVTEHLSRPLVSVSQWFRPRETVGVPESAFATDGSGVVVLSGKGRQESGTRISDEGK